MIKLFDRYVLKEIFPPFFIGLLVYTFVLLMNQILLLSQMFIDRGVELRTVLSLLVYLLPSVLAFTVPMSVLMGILGGLSRMSSDTEITAFKTLGISNKRLLRPVLLFSFCGWLLTSFLTLYSAPRSNYRFVQTLARSVLAKVQFTLSPREFIETIPHTMIYIQDIDRDKTWKNIFVHRAEPDRDPQLVFAESGRFNLFADEKRATLELFNGAIHAYQAAEPEKYSVTEFEHQEIELEVGNFFASISTSKRVREKDIRELWQDSERIRSEMIEMQSRPDEASLLPLKRRDLRAHAIEIHKKFALPVSCFIFAFLGIALGATTRKGGRTSGFTVSIIIIIFYYILITAGENQAMDGRLAPWLGMWGANLILSVIGLYIFLASYRESSLFPSLPWRGLRRRTEPRASSVQPKKRMRRLPRLYVWFPNILDRYIIRKYSAIFVLGFFSMLSIFVIITFFDSIDTVYEHHKTLGMFLGYLWYRIPEFVNYVLPVTAMVSTLLCLGLLTKSNEVTAMKACGLSLYRVVLPVVVLAAAVSFSSFYLQENVLPSTNRKAEDLWNKIEDKPPRSYTQANRRWVMGRDRDRIYHYRYFDPLTEGFSQLSIYDLDVSEWTFKRRIYAEKGFLEGQELSLVNCWYRDFEGRLPRNFVKRDHISFRVAEDRSYFLREWREPSQMRFSELRRYIHAIEMRGFDTVRFRVDLHYKISFPLVSLIMVFLGIPFAFSMGKRGALFGIGLSVGIAVIYWVAVGVFRELGYANFLSPFLAAWGPNLIFGLVGLYLLFTLRT